MGPGSPRRKRGTVRGAERALPPPALFSCRRTLGGAHRGSRCGRESSPTSGRDALKLIVYTGRLSSVVCSADCRSAAFGCGGSIPSLPTDVMSEDIDSYGSCELERVRPRGRV